MPRITSETKLRAVAEENALYLRHLRQTGNTSLAARFARRSRETFAGRRRADHDFDAECAAALVFARANLHRKGAAPVAAGAGDGGGSATGAGLVATGGEYMIGANRNAGLQVRRARPGHVTARGEAAFLEALAATANIRLAADSVGVDPRAFYKRRAQSQAFAAKMGEALAAGYEAVEFALLNTALRSLAPQDSAPHGGIAGDGSAAPLAGGARMSVDQAIALVTQRAKTMAINDRHKRGFFEKLPTPEETDAELLKRLDALARRKERERARAARQEELGGGREADGLPEHHAIPLSHEEHEEESGEDPMSGASCQPPTCRAM